MALGNLIQLSREEALSVGPDKLASVLESPGRMARDVHGLLKLVSAVNAIQGLIWLERPLFELILDVIPRPRRAGANRRHGITPTPAGLEQRSGITVTAHMQAND